MSEEADFSEMDGEAATLLEFTSAESRAECIQEGHQLYPTWKFHTDVIAYYGEGTVDLQFLGENSFPLLIVFPSISEREEFLRTWEAL